MVPQTDQRAKSGSFVISKLEADNGPDSKSKREPVNNANNGSNVLE